jgi:hypothetical protein
MSRSYSGVPHKWAHRVENRSGKVAGKAGNVFYEGERIYSYGHHFCIARLLPSNVVVFGTHKYSSSTGNHQASVRGAVLHLRTVYCHDPAASPSSNKQFAQSEIEDALAEPPKLAKFKELKRLGARVTARREAEKFNAYLAALPEEESKGVKPFDLTEARFNHTPEEAERYAQLVREERERQTLRDAQREERGSARRERRPADMAAAAEKAKTRIPDWRNHKYDGGMWNLPTMLRLSKDKQNVETSKGADIPVTHAKRLWPIIQNCKAVGKGFNDRQIRLGHYTLSEIRPDGSIVVGCHDIPYAEIELIARELGLIEEPQPL